MKIIVSATTYLSDACPSFDGVVQTRLSIDASLYSETSSLHIALCKILYPIEPYSSMKVLPILLTLKVSQ